jgi:ABC-type polysaccharide/polyol phosphate export permease
MAQAKQGVSASILGLDPAFFKQLVIRQLREDYLENITGFAWLILQPLILLAVYAFVFTQIFRSRIADGGDIGFVPYLAIAFWPWTAFSEAILKASSSVSSNAALVSKVAFSKELLPLATVTSTFLMHGVGYLAVLLVLQLLGTDLHWLTLPFVVLIYVLLWILAGAIALFTASLQVFIRDVAQILPPLMTFWFFTTPILYSVTMLPESLAGFMSFNPMTWFMVQLREALLFGNVALNLTLIVVLFLVPLCFALGLSWFRRFSGHFEDFL